MPEAKKFMVENARILWPNFSGLPTEFKPEGGHRAFNVVLTKEMADTLALDGWPVKCKMSTGEDPEEYCFIEVVLKYRTRTGEKTRPPKIVVVNQDGDQTKITEETIDTLDSMDIRSVDIVAREHYWEFAGRSGINAYLQSMYVVIEEDPLEQKYKKKPVKS